MQGVVAVAAPDSPFGLPLWLGIATMFAIVVIRAQATYWIGRAAGSGFAGSRWARRIGRERIDRAERIVARYGPAAVTLSFLTVGVQTAVNAIAGTTRMPFGRYLVAMLAGSVIWATIWTAGGLGVVWGALLVVSQSPVTGGAVLILVIVIGAAAARRRNRARVGEGDRR
ncbi:membrane protein DedA with SNARE-associated domain [Haloactinopolyspora alba]|uniref:Membrane protein DedA with SNARE-associated domain n=1 Tax=Haloactinopolyspora alba TaxID=648780 RepID=A0A2P8DRA0_9ACTN|nr:VTT domain-containing protein [Haloactinopolyspora alba]PSK99743.1 membrane protein DedA with SNARE-associated domain [Haloactinopolyspora alba]